MKKVLLVLCILLSVIGGIYAQSANALAPTPTPTPGSAGTLTIAGVVYDAGRGISAPIGGATIQVSSCRPRSFSATSNQAGYYRLNVPVQYVASCTSVTLTARAPSSSFSLYQASVRVSDLMARPRLDIPMTRVASPTPRPTFTPTPQPTASNTPTADIVLSGMVYDKYQGSTFPIGGTTIEAALDCVPRSFSTVSNQDGTYQLIVPGIYAFACSSITLSAQAPSSSYSLYQVGFSATQLWERSQLNIEMVPVFTPTP
jgi:hypothetical protein